MARLCEARSVLSVARERMTAILRPAADTSWFAALAVSTALHVVLVAVLAWLWVGGPRESVPVAALDSRWQPEVAAPPLVEIDAPRGDAVAGQTDGGREVAALVPAAAPADLPVVFPTVAALDTGAAEGERILREALATEIGAAPAGSDTGSGGVGDGTGTGEGDGDARRFFGAPGHGRRFVYVVDGSSSMNHPHASEWKTRFRRLKVELLQSIGHMTPDMEFYIVFFNEDPKPMPAAALQPATPAVKRRFLDWMARVRAVGRTDPRAALEIALRMQPDTIYFLSDGAFTHRVEVDLKKIRQRRIVIHTFAFGETAGRETLEWVAASNGGQFHFVP